MVMPTWAHNGCRAHVGLISRRPVIGSRLQPEAPRMTGREELLSAVSIPQTRRLAKLKTSGAPQWPWPSFRRSINRLWSAGETLERSALMSGSVEPNSHNSYQRAIRSTLGRNVRHTTSAYLNNRLEQDHRGIKGRIRCMRGFKEHDAADRFCREHDELRNFLRSRSRHNQYVPAVRRRRRFLRHARIVIGIMQIA